MQIISTGINLYKPKYFEWDELLPKHIYSDNSVVFHEIFNIETLMTLDELRVIFDAPITVNNYKWGGKFQYRGYRDNIFYDKYPNSNIYSQHRRGNAFDLDIKGLSAEEVRNKIIGFKKKGFLKHLTGLELDVSWVHFDCRSTNKLDKDGLFLFKP
jgi:hypothetical protein